MNHQQQTTLIHSAVQTLSVVHGRPTWWRQGGGTNPGAISADHNAVYGGWVLTECVSEGGAESLGPLGFPKHRVKGSQFLDLLNVAIANASA